MSRATITEAAAERLADRMIHKRLATDPAYLHAENARTQAAREAEIERAVWRLIHIR